MTSLHYVQCPWPGCLAPPPCLLCPSLEAPAPRLGFVPLGCPLPSVPLVLFIHLLSGADPDWQRHGPFLGPNHFQVSWFPCKPHHASVIQFCKEPDTSFLFCPNNRWCYTDLSSFIFNCLYIGPLPWYWPVFLHTIKSTCFENTIWPEHASVLYCQFYSSSLYSLASSLTIVDHSIYHIMSEWPVFPTRWVLAISVGAVTSSGAEPHGRSRNICRMNE